MSHIQMMCCYVIVTLILKFLLSNKLFEFYFLGKVFPKIHRRTEQRAMSLSTSDDDTNIQHNTDITDEDTSSTHGDYVFRIVFFPDR